MVQPHANTSFSRIWHMLDVIRWSVVYFAVLWPIRVLFEWILPPLLKYFWHNGVYYHYAQDDQPVYENVKCLAHAYPYGEHFRETVDVLVPQYTREIKKQTGVIKFLRCVSYDIFCLLTCYPRAVFGFILERLHPSHDLPNIEEAKKYPAIVFIHGGGYCAVDAAIQHHQTTAFVRAGYVVYSINYPHAPEDPFPSPIISTLKFLNFMKTRQGHNEVTLIGESAGGGIASLVGFLASNTTSLFDFQHRSKSFYSFGHCDMENWEYPSIASISSWYGILDAESWREKNWLWRGLEWTWNCYTGSYPLFERLTNRTVLPPNEPYLSLCCAIRGNKLHKNSKLPPMFLTCGTADPLGLLYSTKLTQELLESLFPDNHIKTSFYEAGHAFIGLNPFILHILQGPKWREMGKSATLESIAFIKKFHK